MVAFVGAFVVIALTAVPAQASALQTDRAKARQLAVEVGRLDARIGAAVQEYAGATASLEAVRQQIRDNVRLQVLAQRELGLARAVLAARAVALYKHDTVSPLDAVFTARDFSDLVQDLTMVRSVTRSDGDVLRTVERARAELADRALTLAADKRTAEKLVARRSHELTSIRAQLAARRTLLTGVRSRIRALAAQVERSRASSGGSVKPPAGGGGSSAQGQWWPLIQSAAAANGVSARGMYRLMMIESGGFASVKGPGGYRGLFQFAPSTWRGVWNPYRSASITDGAAQIRAAALALHLGYGHAWWDPSYSWAFQGS